VNITTDLQTLPEFLHMYHALLFILVFSNGIKRKKLLSLIATDNRGVVLLVQVRISLCLPVMQLPCRLDDYL